MEFKGAVTNVWRGRIRWMRVWSSYIFAYLQLHSILLNRYILIETYWEQIIFTAKVEFEPMAMASDLHDPQL